MTAMVCFCFTAWIPFASLTAAEEESRATTVELSPAEVRIVDRDARVQLQVSSYLAEPAAGSSLAGLSSTRSSANSAYLKKDITRDVTYRSEPAGLVNIDSSGLVTPIASGAGEIVAMLDGQPIAKGQLKVELPEQETLINFPNQIVPLFTKYGCNGGGCHGKLSGQNGFRLSLLGFEPREDFEHLVLESRGRRLFPPAPDSSLLLQKSVGTVPHGGGQRMEVDSHDYRLMKRWIAQGMPYGDENHRKVARIQVYPESRMLARNSSQQLAVIATYLDGQREDITRTVQYESNNLDMADVTPAGLVTLRDRAGEVSIMARYQGNVAVFRASIPLGVPNTEWPTSDNAIDAAVFAKLKTLGIPPSSMCDDATYLRRVTLDIAGRLPTQDEIEQSTQLSREEIVSRLLESDSYAHYFASKWSAILRNRHSSAESKYASFLFHDWLVTSFQENKPFDKLVRELLTASGTMEIDPALAWLRQVDNTDSRIEDLSQLFLGQRLQCARCHHHPYEKWGQQDYYHMAAFLTTVERRDSGKPQEPRFVAQVNTPMARNPKNGVPLAPAGLDTTAISPEPTQDPRLALADWMTAPSNPYFAKSIANRYWKHFMGRGLVEPEDDMRITNPPSNPELLEALAKTLVESNYDLKQLVKAICLSKTYQLSEAANPENIHDTTCYSRFYPKRMNAEVLLDSIDDVLGIRSQFDSLPSGTRAIELPSTSFASYFLTVFGRPDSATSCECERTTESNLAQSLHLMNSKEMNEKLAVPTNKIAQWVASHNSIDPTDPAFDQIVGKNIRELYLKAFSRSPSDEEQSTATKYVSGRHERLREAYEDLVWSVINSKEFLFNH
jgi:hypothetical protein